MLGEQKKQKEWIPEVEPKLKEGLNFGTIMKHMLFIKNMQRECGSKFARVLQ